MKRTIVVTVALAAFVVARAHASPCGTGPASGVYAVLLMKAEGTPLRTQADFDSIQKTLDFYCFKETNTGWSYAGSTAEVLVIVRAPQATISILLLPYTPSRFGDSALAALIDRASRVSTSDGDAIDLEFTQRALSVAGTDGIVAERLGFRLDGGVWFRTSATVVWSPPNTR